MFCDAADGGEWERGYMNAISASDGRITRWKVYEDMLLCRERFGYNSNILALSSSSLNTKLMLIFDNVDRDHSHYNSSLYAYDVRAIFCQSRVQPIGVLCRE